MNCIIVDDEEMSRVSLEFLCNKISGLNIVAVCHHGADALQVLRENSIDLVFMDIEMPDITGLDIVKNVTDLPQIIFITSKEEYALEAFEYEVTDYVKKPVTLPRLIKAIDKAKKKINETIKKGEDGDIFIKVNTRLIRLKNDEVLYVETFGDYVIFHTTTEKFTVHSTLKSIGQKLDAQLFFKVHRSYIVNLKKIVDIEENSLVIEDKVIPISRSQRPLLLEKINLI